MWYMHKRIILAIRKNESTTFSRLIKQLQITRSNKISQTQTNKYHTLSLMCKVSNEISGFVFAPMYTKAMKLGEVLSGEGREWNP